MDLQAMNKHQAHRRYTLDDFECPSTESNWERSVLSVSDRSKAILLCWF